MGKMRVIEDPASWQAGDTITVTSKLKDPATNSPYDHRLEVGGTFARYSNGEAADWLQGMDSVVVTREIPDVQQPHGLGAAVRGFTRINNEPTIFVSTSHWNQKNRWMSKNTGFYYYWSEIIEGWNDLEILSEGF